MVLKLFKAKSGMVHVVYGNKIVLLGCPIPSQCGRAIAESRHEVFEGSRADLKCCACRQSVGFPKREPG